MDTWKAVDEEGNLAFVRGTRLLYETTGEKNIWSIWKPEPAMNIYGGTGMLQGRKMIR